MEKQLDRISEEAMNDLNQIFEEVMVKKIITKNEENQKKLSLKILEIKDELKNQENQLERIEKIEEVLGVIPKDLVSGEDEEDEFKDDNEKVNVSSVLSGTALKSIENNHKLSLLLKRIGTFKSDSMDEKMEPTLIGFIQKLHHQQSAMLEEDAQNLKELTTETVRAHQAFTESLSDQNEMIEIQLKNYSKKLESVVNDSKQEILMLQENLANIKNEFEEYRKGNLELLMNQEKTISRSFKFMTLLGVISSGGVLIVLLLQVL